MTLFRHIRACNAHDLSHFRRFLVADRPVGWVGHALARRLADLPGSGVRRTFEVSDDAVRVAPSLDGVDARSEAVGEAAARLAERGDISRLRGEDYAVVARWGDAPLMRLDRTAVTAFGTLAFGVHVNGWVRTAGGVELWIGRRAADREVEPGKLDNLVGGGQPYGLTLAENLAKECEEEAGLPAGEAARCRPAGAVAYARETPAGLKRDVLFCYDLELPETFRPENRDGEIDAFFRWPVARVEAALRDTDDFKFNVPLVIIDFLIRRGLIGPDDPEYAALATGRPDGVPAP